MRILQQSRVLEVEDGETIAIIAKTPGPTVADPCDNYPYVAKTFRVVADRIGPTLQLVPLSTEPVKLSQFETNALIIRETDPKAELPPIPPCGGKSPSGKSADWDRDTGNGFNERGYAAGQGTYHDPMG